MSHYPGYQPYPNAPGGYQQPPPQQQQTGGAYGTNYPPATGYPSTTQPYGSTPSNPSSYGGHPSQQMNPYGPGGGYPPQQGYGAPTHPNMGRPPVAAQKDPNLWNFFVGVDADRSGQIDVNELHQALRNGDWQPYGLDTLHILMGMFDVDKSGTINFDEFQSLWKYLSDWQKCFLQFDTDRTGAINATELSQALRAFGYQVSDRVSQAVIRKHSKPGFKEISFDKFIKICVTVKQLSESFMSFDQDRDGWIQINYDDFLHMVVSKCP